MNEEHDIEPAQIGDRVENRFVILSHLGEGGMGVVYLAQDEKAGNRKVALKFPKKELHYRKGFRSRFGAEIDVLIAFEHPHVVRIYEHGVHHGLPFMVLPYLSGGTLAQLIEQGGPQTPDEVMRWLGKIARALDALHAAGTIHRDVKAGNIMFDAHGEPHVSDFGIAKVLLELERQQGTRTEPGAAIGSPESLAPEYVFGNYTPAYDQYGLATTVYNALAGKAPFAGSTGYELQIKLVQEMPPALETIAPNVSGRLAAVVMKGLAKSPTDRHASCGEFAAAFEQALHAPAQKPSVKLPPMPEPQHVRNTGDWTPSRRTIWIPVAIGVAALAGTIAWLALGSNGPTETPTEPPPIVAADELAPPTFTPSPLSVTPDWSESPPPATAPQEKPPPVEPQTQAKARQPAMKDPEPTLLALVPGYRILKLPSPYAQSFPRQINNRREIVGRCGERPCYWSASGKFRDLGAGPSLMGGASDINDRGEVVGYNCRLKDKVGYECQARAFVWTSAMQVPKTVGPQLCDEERALSINAHGQIVGTCQRDNGRFHVFLALTAGSDAPFIGETDQGGGYSERRVLIDDSGNVLVNSRNSSSFLWKASSRTTETLQLSSDSRWAHIEGVNSKGQVAGWNEESVMYPLESGPFIWISGGGITRLPKTLSGDGTSTQAMAINEHGDVVGYQSGANQMRAIVWTAKSGHKLRYLADVSSFAMGINDAGEIVGRYLSQPAIWIPE